MKRLILLAFVLFVLAGCSASAERLNNRGNQAFASQDYDRALRDYLIAQAALPERPEPGYNAANTHYRQGDLQAAEQRLLAAIQNAEDGLAQSAHYNLGNVYFKIGNYHQAVASYKEALRLDPNDMEAKHNLELALRRLQEEQQPGMGEQPQETEQPMPTQVALIQPTPIPQSEETEQPSDSQPRVFETLTPEQARQLLEAAGEGVQSLQQHLQMPFEAPGNPPAQEW